MGPLFESPLRPLLKLSLQPMPGYGTCQETISRRHEQMQLKIEMAWGGAIILVRLQQTPGAKMGPLFESPLRPLMKSGLQPLA